MKQTNNKEFNIVKQNQQSKGQSIVANIPRKYKAKGIAGLHAQLLLQLLILQLIFKMFHFSTQQTCYYNFDTTVPGILGYFYPLHLDSPAIMYNIPATSDFIPHFLLSLTHPAQQKALPSTTPSQPSLEPQESPPIDSITEQRRRVEIRQREDSKQKFGRNIGSNIIHLIIKFIKEGKKLRKRVEAVIERDCMGIKASEFFHMLNVKSAKLEAYITSKHMEKLWRGPHCQGGGQKVQKEAEFSRIFRILGKAYLMDHHLPYAFNSNKIKKASKCLHPAQIRRILSL